MTLLHLAIRCHKCGAKPAIRVTRREIELHRSEPPEQITKTYQCRCGEVYAIPAKAYQDAGEAA